MKISVISYFGNKDEYCWPKSNENNYVLQSLHSTLLFLRNMNHIVFFPLNCLAIRKCVVTRLGKDIKSLLIHEILLLSPYYFGSSNFDITSKLQVNNAAVEGAIAKDELWKLHFDEVCLSILYYLCLSLIKAIIQKFEYQ